MQDPQSEFFGKTFTGVPPGRRVLSLTFDDGPNGADTGAVLDVLREFEVRATFFVVGKAAEQQPRLLYRMVREGHALGNHSWSHVHLNVCARETIRRELQATDAAIYRATGERTTLVRPPFGARSFVVLDEIRRLGYQCVLWSVPMAREWDRPGTASIAERIVSRTRDGAILALHDGDRGRPADRREVVAATRLVLSELLERSYRFVTVPEMLALAAQ